MLDTTVTVGNGRSTHWGTDCGTLCGAAHRAGLFTAPKVVSAEAVTCKRCIRIMVNAAEAAHAEAIEMDERRTIARAYLSTPIGVVLTDDEIDEACAASEQATEDLIKGHEQATPKFAVGDVVRHRIGSARVRTVTAVDRVGNPEWVMLNDGGNVWVKAAHLMLAPKLDDVHAEALTINDKMDQVARLEAHPSIEARRVAYEIRDEIMAAGFSEQAIADVPKRTVKAPKVEIHTAGELHTPPCTPRVTFAYNLSDLLDDPARKPDADLVKRNGLDPRMEDFVFCTEGAIDLFEDMKRSITRQLARGKSVVVMILCRGGKHRSVAFGENLALHYGVKATHHHIDLPIVKYPKAEAQR